MTTARQRAILLTSTTSFALAAVVIACGSGFFHGIGGGGGGVPEAGSDAPAPLCYDPIPAAPSIKESPQSIQLLFAMEDIRLDTTARDAGLPPPEGRDLDRTCTCAREPAEGSCVGPGASACDGPRGQDDAFGPVFNQVPILLPSLDFGLYIKSGVFTALVDVQQWNGEDEDPAVTVAIRMSQGLEGAIDGGKAQAQFNGTDVWTIDPGTILDGANQIGRDCSLVGVSPCIPLYNDTKAYVTGGILYARIDVPVILGTQTGRIVFDLKDSRLIAKLSKPVQGAAATYRLDGEIVGRVPDSSILSSIAAVRDVSTGKSLCGDVKYVLLKSVICGALDIASDPAKDGHGAPCDAVSLAMRFTAGIARVGQVFQNDGITSDCPTWTDSCSK